MKFLIASLVSALLVTSVRPVQSRQAGDQSDIPAEEYAIYAAVIGNMFAGDKVAFDSQSKVKLLIIEDQTATHTLSSDVVSNLKQQFSSISQETIDDFVRKNAKSHQLTKSFDIKLKYALTPKEKIEQIFKSGLDGWSEFYKQFPNSGGYIALSRAGLNPGGDQALVYIEHVCGWLCGSGHYLLLAKNDHRWAVQKSFMAWVS
jgi:hypothetical protein